MKEEEIDAMAAGREIDALIAEKVMGWASPASFWPDSEWRPDYAIPPQYLPTPRTFNVKPVPDSSTNIAAAWAVVKQLGKLGLSRQFVAAWGQEAVWHWSLLTEAAFCLHVCRAALKMVCVEEVTGEKKYRVGHVRPSGSIEWLDTLYTEEEARRQCDIANYAEAGGRTLEAAGHSASERRDSGFRWIYEDAAPQ